jgi:hypothetical protein
MIGTTLSHYRITDKPGRVSAPSRDERSEAEGSLPQSGRFL